MAVRRTHVAGQQAHLLIANPKNSATICTEPRSVISLLAAVDVAD